ncbi:SET domain-containing protein SmydA-8-like [Culicoides brevitarsis]|uniref:SET domain-containing protein SmydA-8-like n=1 Tax=Culicoides brevitarsis TaxID=469753 RepID=UPI00307B9050
MSTKKVNINENTILGRHLVATSEIRAGELILSEKPVCVGPKWGTKPCCINCYRKYSKTCGSCNLAPLCQSCEQHDASECELYKSAKWDKEFIIQNFDIVTPIRVLMLSNSDKDLFEEIMKMESRLIARRGTNIWKLHEKYVVLPIISSNLTKLFPNVKPLDAELIQKICAILDINAIEVRGAREILPDKAGKDPSFILRGLYRHPALLVHNCLANAFMTIDADFNVKLYAGQDVKHGDIVSYNYAQVLLGTKERRSQLEKSKNFICNCRRCMDPQELGTFIGSVQCPACRQGLCSFMEARLWLCEKCNETIDTKKVETLIDEAKKSLSALNEDIFEVQQWIDKYSTLLNPKHWIVLDAKQILAGLLKIQCGTDKGASMKLLKKKLDLYEELVPIIKTLRPGLSKMLGIALYEHQLSLTQVAQKSFDAGSISEELLLEHLIRAETILKDSISNLVFEHKTTPEGQLCKHALVNLKDLRGLMELVKGMVSKKQEISIQKTVQVRAKGKKSKGNKK